MKKRQLFCAFLFCVPVIFFNSCRKEPSRGNQINDNKPPIANAGPDQTTNLPTNSVTLDGNNSSDPDNNITAYHWTSVSGPSVFNIADADAPQTTVSALVEGIYHFELKVTDAGGLFSKDTVEVMVVSRDSNCHVDGRQVIQARLVPIGKLSIGRTTIIAAATDNKIIFAGGYSYNVDTNGLPMRRIDIYDIDNNNWTVKDLVEFPTWRADMGIASADNKVFIAGGGFWGDDIYTARVDIYNGLADSWSSASLTEARSAITGVAAANKVFFAGGYSFNNGSNYWSNMVDIFDNTTNTWTAGTLSEPRGFLSAVHGGHKVYFAGGQKNDGNFLPSDRIDEYDLVTNTWSTSSLQEPRTGMGVISAGNKVFFAGGFTGSGESGTVEIRDVFTETTSVACIIPRGGLSAVLKDDKIVFFTGSGTDSRNGTHFEIYSVATDTWYTAVLNKSITNAVIISVKNVIYIAGGFVNGIGSDQVWKLEF